MKLSSFLLLAIALLLTSICLAQNYFDDFPVMANPTTVGEKLRTRFLESKHQLYGDRGIHYAEVCTWYGALKFAELTNDYKLLTELRTRF